MQTKTAYVNARIEPESKEKAETILAALGISVSNAINIYYKQIIIHNGLPFDMTLPTDRPVDVSNMTEEEIDMELKKGCQDIIDGNMKVAEDAFKEIRKKYTNDI